MSPMKGSSIPSQWIATSGNPSLLPFLYNTRTLCSGLQAGFLSPAFQIHRGNSRSLTTSRKNSSVGRRMQAINEINRIQATDAINAEIREDAQPNLESRRHDNHEKSSSVRWTPVSASSGQADLASERLQNQQRSLILKSTHPRSTLTASEQNAFENIFTEISNNSHASDESIEDTEVDSLDNVFADDGDVPGDPRDQLAAIFEAAITRMKMPAFTSSEDSLEKNTRLKNKSFVEAFKRLKLESASLGSDEESEAHLKRASHDHRQRVDSLLVAAKDDLQIWAILEKEVFSLMSKLDLQLKHEEKARRREHRRQKKGGKSPSSIAPPAKLDSDIETAMPLITSGPSQNPAADKTKTLDTITTFWILQSNYAHHTVRALRLFRTLKLSSSYAHALLPRIKALGPISYVLGATTPLYNELIFQKWVQYSDVPGLADLMQEMVNQGVTPDLATLELLRFLDRSRRRDLQGFNGAAKKSWWALRPVKEGWMKIKSLYSRFRVEVGDATTSEMGALREKRVMKLELSRSIPKRPGYVEGGRYRRVPQDFDLARRVKTNSGVPSWSPSGGSSPSQLSSVLANLSDMEPERGEKRRRSYIRRPASRTGETAPSVRNSSLNDWE